MLTTKQARAQRKAIARDIAKDLKAKARAKVRSLHAALKEARGVKRDRLKEIAGRCRTERLSVRDRLRDHRARVLAELKETARLEREAARAACLLRKGEAKTACDSSVGCAREAHGAEKKYQSELRRIEQGNRVRLTAHAKASRKEKAAESDDEVRANIPPDLVPLFERVKRGIKPGLRQSRTEAFLHYAEMHPHEVFEMIDDKTEELIRKLEEKHRMAKREGRPAGARKARNPAAKAPRYTPEELMAVPF